MLMKTNLVRPFLVNNSRNLSYLSAGRCNSLLKNVNRCISFNKTAKNIVESCSILRFGRSISTTIVQKQQSPVQDNSGRKKRSLPALMDFPEIVWPSLLKTLKNYIMVHLIIRPYFDQDFRLQDFIDGSKQAIAVISNAIATGTDIDSLRGLVTQEALDEIKKSVSQMSMAQRTEIGVNKDDVYFSFPYQIGIMFDEDGEVQKRWVEITMVYHNLRGAKEMNERQEPIPINIGLDPDYQDKFSICNYRFIKEFTTNQHSDWVVNVVNHFKPIDLVTEKQGQ